MINIAFINNCTKVSDKEALMVMNHLQIQADRDFYPHWNIQCKLHFVKKGETPHPDYWWLSVLDHSDQADALGYHDMTPAGLPLGKIFALDSVADGGNWSVTASHELLEMLVDPWVNLSVFCQASNTGGTIVAYESCDAVQASTYTIGSVLVSNFVTPAWFQAGMKNTTFDHLGVLTAPLHLYHGGYIGVFQANGKGWTQVTAAKEIMDHSKRMTKRNKDRREWKTSRLGDSE